MSVHHVPDTRDPSLTTPERREWSCACGELFTDDVYVGSFHYLCRTESCEVLCYDPRFECCPECATYSGGEYIDEDHDGEPICVNKECGYYGSTRDRVRQEANCA